MGVDKRYQKQGLGHNLVSHAIERTIDVSELAGAIGLFVDPKDDPAAAL